MKLRMKSMHRDHPFFEDEVDALLAAEHEVLDEVQDMVKIRVDNVPGVRTFKYKRTMWFFKNNFEEV